MLYIIKVLLYTMVMLLIYVLMLRNKPAYQFSRYYLLACAVLPMLIPLLSLPAGVQHRMQRIATFHVDLPEIVVGAPAAAYGNHPVNFPGVYIAFISYIIIAMLFASYTLWNLVRVNRIIRRGTKINAGAYILITGSRVGPGSFGRYIFFPDNEVNDTILEHEEAHVRLHHTRDLLLLSLVQVVLWPNFFLIWIKKELKSVHEFQADTLVNADRAVYTQLILSSIFSTTSLPVMHSFIVHPIKRRIMMLQKNGKASPVRAAILVSVSMLIFLSIAVSAQSVSNQKNAVKESPGANDSTRVSQQILAATPPDVGDPKPDKTGVYSFADKMPVTASNYQEFLAKNIVYPAYAKNKGIEGRVVVRFVVDENGMIKNPVVVKSPDNSLSNEALRVMNKMPAWIPGEHNGQKVPVYFTLPIVFKLDHAGKTTESKQGDVKITPNPAEGSFNIVGTTGASGDEEVSITITDLKGTVVGTKNAIAHNGSLNEQIQLRNSLPNGMYMVHVQTATLDKVLHALIQR